jgi:hypothetical protein
LVGALVGTLGVKSIAMSREAAMISTEAIEQRKAYLEQTDAVARELGKLTIVSVRTLGYLAEGEPDAKLLDAIQLKSNDVLALQRQLRELWRRS